MINTNSEKNNYLMYNENMLIEYVKNVIPMLHYFISHNQLDVAKKYCSEELLNKLIKYKEQYRISNNFDNVKVGYARVERVHNNVNSFCINLYTSIFFYDDVDNNIDNTEPSDKFWNDIWIVTLAENKKDENQKILNKCPSCGASMDFDSNKKVFTCNYCRNSLYYSRIDWIITDISIR